ncbi:MAG: hypothetical protein HYR90_00910 [Candidatus Andersenbacteria bacterium]|nr:hypothetical protein [Candidatus Andersenbacteria bacterium]MBI3251191.1 hypothetical protein [Candidatus Andersenbacteria bacterium]
MKNTITIAKGIKTPYRPQDLLRRFAFIRFCKKQGLETNPWELAYLERTGLLQPVDRVDRGILKWKRILRDHSGLSHDEKTGNPILVKLKTWDYVPREQLKRRGKTWYQLRPRPPHPPILEECEAVDPNTYYSQGWYFHQSDIEYSPAQKTFVPVKDWLKPYRSRRRVVSPPKESFYEVSDTPPPDDFFVTDPKDLGNSYESFYSIHQLYPLYVIQKKLQPIIKSNNFFLIEKGRKIIEEKIAAEFTASAHRRFEQNIKDYYHFLKFYLDVLNLWENTQATIQEKAKEIYHEAYEKWPTTQKVTEQRAYAQAKVNETIDKAYLVLRDDLALPADEIFEKHVFTIPATEDWREKLLKFGYDLLGITSKPARQSFSDKHNENSRYSRHAAFRMAHHLTWIIELRE